MDGPSPPAKVKLYVFAVVAAALPVYAWAFFRLAHFDYTEEQWASLLGITFIAWLGSSWVVRIPRTITWMAVADCLTLSVTMIYGIAPGVLAHGPSCLVSY